MKKLYKKNIILLVIASTVSLSIAQTTRASIIDDFLNAIGITSEKKETEEKVEVIEKELADYLDSRQQEVVAEIDKIEVVAEIDKIYNNIQNMDIDAIAGSIDYNMPKQTIANVKDFFDDYENGLENAKSIAKTLKYKIESVTNIGDKVIAKITYTYPSIPKAITKVLPEIVIKNAGLIFGGAITNDTIDSVLESIKKELQKGSYEVETFTREFAFEKIRGKWKMVEVDGIVKDLTKYINEIGNNLFK